MLAEYWPRRNDYWINSGKGGSGNFSDLFIGINSFQTDSSNFTCKKSNAWRLLETIINSRQSLSRNKVSKFSEIYSWKHFSGSAIILVPTVFTQAVLHGVPLKLQIHCFIEFVWGETLWDSSLLIFLALWDTPALALWSVFLGEQGKRPQKP